MPRRTQLKIGITKDNTIVPQYSSTLKDNQIENWEGECAVGGIFLLAPIIEHFGIPKLVENAKLPSSGRISALNYVFSMLALKLIGNERLSQINDFTSIRAWDYLPSSTISQKARPFPLTHIAFLLNKSMLS